MDSGQQGQDFERDYFETLIKKYETRNAQFAEKQCDLRQRLEAIECSLPTFTSLNITHPNNAFQQPISTEYDNSPVKEVTNMNHHLGRTNNFGKTIGQTIKTSGLNTGEDILYMAKIKELAENERKLKNEIKELEDKEKTYNNTAKQPDNYVARNISYNGEGDAEIEGIKQKNHNLEERNKALEDELEEVRKEIKHIKETVEEPMRRELENEKCRCIDIEEEIHKRNADVNSRESAQRKKVEFLQKQLQCANQNLSDLHVVNKRLKEELCMLNCRSNELQTDLINQKISEVHIISRVIASQNMEPTPPPPKPVLSLTGSGDNHKGGRGGGNEELNKIARNLSKLIDEANSCNNCKNTHPDLIDTVRYIKNLVDIVNDRTDAEEIPESDSDVFCKCVDWKKIREEMELEEPQALPEESASEPDVSKPSEIAKPPISIKPEVEEPSEITDKRTSASITAAAITNAILDDVIPITVIADHKDKIEKIEEDTTTEKLEEGDTEATTDFQTEHDETTVTETGDITDVSKTEPPTDMTEDESEAITTDVDETGEPAEDKPTEEEIISPEESEKPLEKGETTSEVPEKVEIKPPSPTEAEESLKEDIKTDEGEIPPEEAIGDESVKPVDGEEMATEEAVEPINVEETEEPTRPADGEEVVAQEFVKPVDGEEIAAEDSVQPVDVEEITAEESLKPVDEGELAAEESVKLVDGEEIAAEESVKPVDEEEMAAGESIKPVAGEEIAAEESVKPVVGEEIAAEESLKPVDEEEIAADESVKPVVGEEIAAAESVKPIDEEETAAEGSVKPVDEEKIAVEEPIDGTESVIPIEEEKATQEVENPAAEEEITPGELEEPMEGEEVASIKPVEEGEIEAIEPAKPTEEGEIATEEPVKEGGETEEPTEHIAQPEEIAPEQDTGKLEEEVPPVVDESIKLDEAPVMEEITEESEMPVPVEAVQDEGEEMVELEEEPKKSEEEIKEEKPLEIEKPVSPDKELVEEIVRTICRCIRRDKPALCDCPVGDTKESKKDSGPSKEDVIQKILSDVVSEMYPTGTDIKDKGDEMKTSPKGSKPTSNKPSEKSLEEIITDKPPVSPKASKSLSKDASEKSLPKDDAASKKSEISPKGSKTSKQPSEKSIEQKKDDIPAETVVVKPVTNEPSKKSIEEKEETEASSMPSKLHSKEPSKISVEEKEKTDVSQKPSKLRSEKTSKESIEQNKGTGASPKPSKIASKEPSKISLEEKETTRPSPKVSKPSSKEPSQKSLPREIDVNQASEKPSSPKLSTTVSKDLPHATQELAPGMKAEEKTSNLFDEVSDTSPKLDVRSKPRSKEPSSKSLPPEIGASPKSKSKEKASSEVLIMTARVADDAPSKEPSTKLSSKEAISSTKPPSKEASTKSFSKRGKSVSKELSIKSPSADIIRATPTEEEIEEKEMVIADFEAEGNVPVEAEVELLSKSSDGVYVTTTVTSTGQVEVTTEGPTGVVETTLKVTESGNLEVMTGVTEFNKDAEGVVSKAESDHPASPEVEVLHAAVYNVEESQEGLDVHEADNIREEVTTQEGPKEEVEEVRPSTEGALCVITEEEEEAAEKDRKPIEQIPADKKYCECPPPIVVCKCKEDDEASLKNNKCKSSQYEEIDESKERAIVLCKCNETEQRIDEVETEKDGIVGKIENIEIKEEETPEGSDEEGDKKESDEEGDEDEESLDEEDEPEDEEGAIIIQNTVIVPSIKSVEIVENSEAKDACRTPDDEENDDYDVNSGSTVSEVSMFDDLPPDVMKTLKETSTTTVESAPAKSFVIETTIEYKSSERVLPPQKEERASKSILKTGSSWNDSWRNINTQYSNQATAEANQERGVIKKRSVEGITVSTSTTGLKFTTCTCDEKIQPSKRAKSESLEQEEPKQVPNDKQGTITNTTPGNTTVNNLKIIICNRDTCRTYTTDQESRESIPKLPTCDCQKKTQPKLSRVCNAKTCGTIAGKEQDRKLKTKGSDKLLLENATCTTCDITSCQVIKSGTNYSSLDSLLSEDEPIICPATCQNVGTQHAPRKLFDERSYEGMHNRTAYFKGTTSRSVPGKVCTDTFSKSEGVCVPKCASKGIQRDANIKHKTHATNTPKSNKICAADVCRSSPSGQRTVSTYYSSNAAQSKSCDPIECEKRLSNVKFQDPVSEKACDPNICRKQKPKSPSEPKMSFHRTCACKDATTDYKPPSSPNLKRSSIIKKPRSTQAVDAPPLSQTCICKGKSTSKKPSSTSKTSSMKTEDLMTTACTSLTCSGEHSASDSKPESPTSDKSQITTSCTCTTSKPESPSSGQTQITTSCTCSGSKPDSPTSGQTQITTSCTCSKSKPESPGSKVCTSETCSVVRNISGSKPDSPTSGQTQITTSCTCPGSKPESPVSKVCTSETCSAIRKISGSKPESPTSGQTQITTSCTCPRSKPESPVSKVCTSETCSAVKKFSGSKPESPTSGQTQITTSCTCPRSKPESPVSKVCTSETCSAVKKISGSKPESPTSGQTQITTSCTCPRSKPESPVSKVCTSETCSAAQKISGSKPDSPTSGQITTSCTCSESKPKSPASDTPKICNSATCPGLQTGSKPESPTSDQTDITTSCICPGTKPDSPVSDKTEICTSATCAAIQKVSVSKRESLTSDKTDICTSATCSGLIFYTPATSLHSSIPVKTPSKVSQGSSQYSAPCRSGTCSGMLSKGSSSHRRDKKSSIISQQETPCRSTTCSNTKLPPSGSEVRRVSEEVPVESIVPCNRVDTQPDACSPIELETSSTKEAVIEPGEDHISDTSTKLQTTTPCPLEDSISDEEMEKDVIDDSKLLTPEKKDSSLPSTDDGITHPEAQCQDNIPKECEVMDYSRSDTIKSKSPSKTSTNEEFKIDPTSSLPDRKDKTPPQEIMETTSSSARKAQDDDDQVSKRTGLKSKISPHESTEIKVTDKKDKTPPQGIVETTSSSAKKSQDDDDQVSKRTGLKGKISPHESTEIKVTDKKDKTPPQGIVETTSSSAKKSQDDDDQVSKRTGLKGKISPHESTEIKVTPYFTDTDREDKEHDSKFASDKVASETTKISKPSVGDIPKSPKSASKYTLAEKIKKSVEKVVSTEKNVVSAKSSQIPVEKTGKREENLKSADSKIAEEKISKDQAGSIRSKDSAHGKLSKEKISREKAVSIKSKESEHTKPAEEKISKEKEISITSKESESSKIAHTASGSSQHSQQSSRRPSKEISKKSSGASKKSDTLPVETPQGTEGETEITNKVESADKLPSDTKPGSGQESKPTSKESLCLPCRKMQKASGDKISKPPKEPPDKGSKTSVGSTDSQKKSKIPIVVSKTSSIDKEKHQGDCSCIECLTEEMQKDKHPPDCDCVDCLCQPQKFEPTLPTIEEPEHAKEPESIPHSPSCTCIDCLCEPKGITKKPSVPPPEVMEKPKHSPDCACVDCLCAPTGNIIKKVSISRTDEQKGSTIIAFTCPSIPPAKVATHHPDCKCPECVCDPCGHRPGCSCALCKCDPCKDEIIEFKKHPPDCTCPDCICAPCGDEKAEEKKKHPPHCDCAECACVPCNDSEVENKKPIMEPHPKDCDCSECLCKPCNDKKVELVSQHTQHEAHEEHEEHKKHEEHEEDGSCTCKECICDPCADPKVALKKIACKDCGCLVCICDPCEDPKMVEKRKPHPPTCNCPECICDPCNDPEAIRAHSPDCTCRRCICKPCKPREKPHGPTCDCPKCICAPCKDTDKKKDDTSTTEPHKPDCKCKKCVCKPRKLHKKPEEPHLDPGKKKSAQETCKTPNVKGDDTCEPQVSRSPQKSPESIEKHGPRCKCATCKLSKMSPTKTRTATRDVDLPGIPEECPECDCSPICVCDDCPAKKNNTAPTAKNMKNEMLVKNIKDIEQENVRREKDINELEELMEQIRCACHDAERQAARTAEPTYIQKASSFKNTLSGLQIAMNTLQEKCMVKDKMIEAMTQELRIRANSNIFHDMLKNIKTAPPVNVDFDRQEVCDSLPRPINDPKYGRSSSRYPQDGGRYECICEHGSINMQILNIKQISPDSILIKWTQPENNKVIGYEVEVDNVLKSRIHSAQRTSAMVFAVNVKNKMNISVYALTPFGRCQPPATCVYG